MTNDVCAAVLYAWPSLQRQAEAKSRIPFSCCTVLVSHTITASLEQRLTKDCINVTLRDRLS